MKRLLGIDIGGTKCAVCLGRNGTDILGREEIATGGSPDAVLEKLVHLATGLQQQHGPAEAVGIVCGGPLDAARGVVLSPPNLPGWDEVPVVAHFSNHLGLPALLQNDANAGALAEWRYGAGIGSRNLMFCTMGTGFGCGLVLDGRLFEGANGNAGEIGHIRLSREGPVGFGKAGSVEGWCSGGGIAQVAGVRLRQLRAAGGRSALLECENLTTRAAAEAADAGDALAVEIFKEVGGRLGEALAIAIDLLNPDTIVIGSIFARCEKLLRPAMEAVLQRECLPHALAACRVKPAALGERIGDVAALVVADLALEKQA